MFGPERVGRGGGREETDTERKREQRRVYVCESIYYTVNAVVLLKQY